MLHDILFFCFTNISLSALNRNRKMYFIITLLLTAHQFFIIHTYCNTTPDKAQNMSHD